MRIYLAGPIFGCTDEECRGWREDIKGRLPAHEYLDPMDRDYRGRQDEHFEEIVRQDLKAIRSSQVVVAYAARPSWGTAMELWDAMESGLCVVAIVPEGPINPWLRFVATEIVSSMDEAVETIKGFERVLEHWGE